MSTLAEIERAIRKLPPKQRTDLLESLARDRSVEREQRSRLRALVEAGVRDHAAGRTIEIKSAGEHREFFAAIKRRPRAAARRPE